MCPQDYKAVHELWGSCDGIGLNEIDDSESGIARFLFRNPDTCFVAKVDETIVGAILAGNDGRRGYIYHLAVEKQYRGKGIARQLTNMAVSALEHLGIQKAGLVVFSDNKEGNAFWDRLGFTVREDLTYRNKMTKKS
ncbi:MAG: GNAT family N-acetyltransferase [Lachnospiraceae bacterium]|nr:GNAT family N-acetyltransferase [Lachnospiraceae bacterium]